MTRFYIFLFIWARSFSLRTALLVSIANGNVALAKVLLRRGADATKSDNEGKSPLYVALLGMANTELSQEIVKSGGRRSLEHCIAGGLYWITDDANIY